MVAVAVAAAAAVAGIIHKNERMVTVIISTIDKVDIKVEIISTTIRIMAIKRSHAKISSHISSNKTETIDSSPISNGPTTILAQVVVKIAAKIAAKTVAAVAAVATVETVVVASIVISHQIAADIGVRHNFLWNIFYNLLYIIFFFLLLDWKQN